MFSLPERELGLDEIVSMTIRLYMSRFPLIYVPFLVASLPMIAIEVIVLAPLLAYFNSYMTSQMSVAYVNPMSFNATTIMLGVVLLALYFLLEFFVYGFAIVTSAALINGGKTNAVPLLNDTYKRYWRYLAATLMLMIGFGGAFLVPIFFLVFPGFSGVAISFILFIAVFFGALYLIIRLSLYPQAIYLEDVGVLGSMRRSYGLLRGRILLTFALFIVIGLISSIPVFVASPISAFFGGVNQWYIGVISSVVISTLASPIGMIAFTVYYYSMRSRHERPPPPPPPF